MKLVSHLVCSMVAGSLLLAVPVVSADTVVGVYLGAAYWDMEADGSFGTSDDLADFNLDDEGKGFAWVAFEHPAPLVPNIKLRYNQLDTEGDAESLDFRFGDFRFSGDAEVEANIDHTDIILYYELLDLDTVWLDLGANLKYGDYEIVVRGEIANEDGDALISGRESESYEGVLPLVYGAGGVGLPFSGLGLQAEVSWIGYDDYDAYDVMGAVTWLALDNMIIDLQLQVGYRRIDIDLEDLGGIYADADFEGFFGGVQLHF